MSIETPKTVTPIEVKDAIRARLKANMNLDRGKLAVHYNVSTHAVAAIYTHLKIAKSKELNAEANKALEKVNSVVGSFTNQGGAFKETAREKMANYIINTGLYGLIPCFPNTEWVIEQKIANKLKRVSFLGVEMDRKVLTVMRKNLRGTNLDAKTYGGKMSDKIFGMLPNSYAHMLLDYCCTVASMTRELEYVIQNNLVGVGGIIAVTNAKIFRVRTGGETQRVLDLIPKHNLHTELETNMAIEAYFHKITGWNYKVLEFFYYKDKYPMVLTIIQRIK